MTIWMIAAAGLAIGAAGVWAGVPALLRTLGLHRHIETPRRDMRGRRALIVATSCDTLGDTGRKTGVFASEMTAPYYTFLDAGMEVDVASISGGAIPIEPASMRWPVRSAPDDRFARDADFQRKVRESGAVASLDPAAYDIVFLAGGWGAAYDFAQSAQLGEFLTQANAAGAVLGGVCHGPLGLLGARAPDGSALTAGRRLTAVTDKQIRELGVAHTPRHPERDLRASGALFEGRSAFRDIFASHVVTDGTLVTGQNQNDGAMTADRMMQAVIDHRAATAA